MMAVRILHPTAICRGLMYENFFSIYIIIMAILTYKDIKYMEVDDVDILIGIVIACSYHIIINSIDIFLIGGLAGFFLSYLIKKISDYLFDRESLGGGDITVSILIGSFWGWEIMIATWYCSTFLLTIFSVYMFFIKNKNIKGQIVPFLPFMFVGSLISIGFYLIKLEVLLRCL